MTNKEAINWLKIAAPVRVLTKEEFEKFIIAVNMAMEALEGKRKETDTEQQEGEQHHGRYKVD